MANIYFYDQLLLLLFSDTKGFISRVKNSKSIRIGIQRSTTLIQNLCNSLYDDSTSMTHLHPQVETKVLVQKKTTFCQTDFQRLYFGGDKFHDL